MIDECYKEIVVNLGKKYKMRFDDAYSKCVLSGFDCMTSMQRFYHADYSDNEEYLCAACMCIGEAINDRTKIPIIDNTHKLITTIGTAICIFAQENLAYTDKCKAYFERSLKNEINN